MLITEWLLCIVTRQNVLNICAGKQDKDKTSEKIQTHLLHWTLVVICQSAPWLCWLRFLYSFWSFGLLYNPSERHRLIFILTLLKTWNPSFKTHEMNMEMISSLGQAKENTGWSWIVTKAAVCQQLHIEKENDIAHPLPLYSTSRKSSSEIYKNRLLKMTFK